jgi:hypothetical protein
LRLGNNTLNGPGFVYFYHIFEGEGNESMIGHYDDNLIDFGREDDKIGDAIIFTK